MYNLCYTLLLSVFLTASTFAQQGTNYQELYDKVRPLQIPQGWEAKPFTNGIIVEKLDSVPLYVVSFTRTYSPCVKTKLRIYLFLTEKMTNAQFLIKKEQNEKILSELEHIVDLKRTKTMFLDYKFEKPEQIEKFKQIEVLATHQYNDGYDLLVLSNQPYFHGVWADEVQEEYEKIISGINRHFPKKPEANQWGGYLGNLRYRLALYDTYE